MISCMGKWLWWSSPSLMENSFLFFFHISLQTKQVKLWEKCFSYTFFLFLTIRRDLLGNSIKGKTDCNFSTAAHSFYFSAIFFFKIKISKIILKFLNNNISHQTSFIVINKNLLPHSPIAFKIYTAPSISKF